MIQVYKSNSMYGTSMYLVSEGEIDSQHEGYRTAAIPEGLIPPELRIFFIPSDLDAVFCTPIEGYTLWGVENESLPNLVQKY